MVHRVPTVSRKAWRYGNEAVLMEISQLNHGDAVLVRTTTARMFNVVVDQLVFDRDGEPIGVVFRNGFFLSARVIRAVSLIYHAELLPDSCELCDRKLGDVIYEVVAPDGDATFDACEYCFTYYDGRM